MGDFYDEAFDERGEPRPHYRAVLDELDRLDLAGLEEGMRAEVRRRSVRYGETGPDRFVVDPVPRLLTGVEWNELERGLAQRMRALDAFLRDAYSERRIVDAGRLPARVIEDGEFYEPDMQGLDVPVWAGFAGLDLARGADGRFRVLEDNLRMPTGIGFAPLAWEVVSGPMGEALPGRRPLPEDVLERFAATLRASAPDGGGDPAIAVLGDGFENHAQWEISDMAQGGGVKATWVVA